MAAGFDPYYKWLGIPPDEQPPNHYRLLGLRLFEGDPEVIEAASDQRMAHLRTYQSGQYSALSQKLLNEVAAAKICLISPEKRAPYDQGLRAAIAAARAPAMASSPSAATIPAPVPPAVAPSPPPLASRLPSVGPPPLDASPMEPMAPPAIAERSFDLQSLGVTDEEEAGESTPAPSGNGWRHEAPVAADLPDPPAGKPGRRMLIVALALCAVLLGLLTAAVYVGHRRQHVTSPGDAAVAATADDAAGNANPQPAPPGKAAAPAVPPALLEPADKITLPNPDPPAGILLRWQPVVNASRYWVKVEVRGRPKPLLDTQDQEATSVHIRLAHPVPRQSLHGWQWRVRALVNGQWTDWSETRGFDVAESASQASARPKVQEGPQAQQPSLPFEPEKPEKPDVAEKPIERRPVPAEAARKHANQVFRDVYKKQYDAARTVEQRLALADDMLHKAQEIDNDPAAQFVLMERARALSANAGDAAKALEIVAEIDERFEIDSLAMRVETLTDSLQSGVSPTDRNFEIGEKVLEAMQELGQAHKYEAAIGLGAVYRDHARRPVNQALMRRVAAEIKTLRERQQAGKSGAK